MALEFAVGFTVGVIVTFSVVWVGFMLGLEVDHNE